MKSIIFVKQFEDAELPQYATKDSAGVDLRAYIKDESGNASSVTIEPGKHKMVPTGLTIDEPATDVEEAGFLYEVQIRSRSGLANKNQVFVLNTPGTVDADYRGPINIILQNLSDVPFTVNHGDRIAQAVLCRIYSFGGDTKRPDTVRGEGGFGSTGVK